MDLRLVFAATLFAVSVSAQTGMPSVDAPSISDILIRLEVSKWDAVNAGKPMNKTLFAPEFVSIGYQPDGTLEMTEPMKRATPTPPKPSAPFVLSGYRFLEIAPGTAMLTYRAAMGDFRLRATSLWVQRGGKWLTMFYQASREGDSSKR